VAGKKVPDAIRRLLLARHVLGIIIIGRCQTPELKK